MRAEEFLTRSRWIKGPEFLYLPEMEWPVADMDPAVIPADDPKVKREKKVNTIVKYADNATHHFINYFSSWRKLKVAVAWFLQLKRVLSLLSQKRKELKAAESDEDARVKCSVEQKLQSSKATLLGKNLTPQDYDEAEKAIICFVQKQRFASETTSLKGDSNVLCVDATEENLADLPEERVMPDKTTFTNVGVDFLAQSQSKEEEAF